MWVNAWLPQLCGTLPKRPKYLSPHPEYWEVSCMCGGWEEAREQQRGLSKSIQGTWILLRYHRLHQDTSSWATGDAWPADSPQMAQRHPHYYTRLTPTLWLALWAHSWNCPEWALADGWWPPAESQPGYAGQEEIAELSFRALWRKWKEAVSTWPDVLYDQKKAYKYKNFATRGSKKHEAGISTEGLRKPQNPYQGWQKIFLSQSQLVKTGGGDHYQKYKNRISRLQEICKNQGNSTPLRDHNYLPQRHERLHFTQ